MLIPNNHTLISTKPLTCDGCVSSFSWTTRELNTLFTFCLCKLLQNKKIHWVRIKYAQNTACNSQALCYLLLRMPNINSLFEKWVLEVNHPSPHPFMEKYRLLWNSSTNKVHVMLCYVMLHSVSYHKSAKSLATNKELTMFKKNAV